MKKQVENSNIVVGSSRKSPLQWRPSRRQLIVIVSLGVILMVGVYSLFFLRRTIQSRPPEIVKKTEQVTQAASQGNVEATKTGYDKLISEEKDNAKKLQFIQAKANSCAALKDYACAIATADQALQVKSDDLQMLISAGDWSRLSSQTDKSNEYYKKAIEVLKADGSKNALETAAGLQNLIDGKPAGQG